MQESQNQNTSEMRIPEEFRGQKHHAHVGPILAVLVIMLVIILGGLYLWGGALTKQTLPVEEPVIVNDEPETPRAEADQQIYGTLSPSDELEAIEADLTSTNFDSLDADITTIDTEFDAALAE